jgi:predicted P-loop ATPase
MASINGKHSNSACNDSSINTSCSETYAHEVIPQISSLLSGLNDIPSDWALTPVNGEKRPYRSNWQNEGPIKRQDLAKTIKSGNAKGYGLRTGKWSNGILAVDADGYAAHDLLKQLGGLPTTVSFTSGKPGRCQYLVRVPQEYWNAIKTKKLNAGKGEDGKDQLLELRWDGCQSVLPPSVHPETGSYKWVNSPQDCEIAIAPTWLLKELLPKSSPATTKAVIITGSVPLYQCLTKDDRDLINKGIGEGGRDDNGAKLARNLIGTSARLTHLGHDFDGSPRQLFDDYCARCSPPLSAGDADRIWKSAEKSNPSATLTDDALENCIKAWQRNQNIKTDADDENFKPPKSNFNPDNGQFGDTQEEPCKHKLQLLKVKQKVGTKLKFNLMTQQVEFNDEPLDLDDAYLFLAEEFNIQISKGNAPDIILKIARNNAYHPVADYLQSNYMLHKNVDINILNDISTRYFGTTEDIYNVMMRKTLIGAVARVLDPGCKFDTATILQGDQDIKKSTFWATLAGKNWFDDTFGDIEAKDELSKLTRYWCVEFAEFENVTTKKAAGAVKKFLSTQSDRYRVPYGRSVKEFPRTSFVVGSVNPVGILNDPTGDRRFWVIPVKKNKFNQIDIKRLERERNLLWAAAVHLYKTGEIFYLTDDEKVLANESNKDFQVEDSWEVYVNNYLMGKDFVAVADILTEALDIERGKHDRTAMSRVTGILRRFGWERIKKRVNKSEIRGWGLKVESQPESLVQQDFLENPKNDGLTTVSVTVSATTQSPQEFQDSETLETLKNTKLLNFDSNDNGNNITGNVENGWLEKNKSLAKSAVSTVSRSQSSHSKDSSETAVRPCSDLVKSTVSFSKDAKVKYTGTELSAQFTGDDGEPMILEIKEIRGDGYIVCLKPDGYRTKWFSPEELKLVSQPVPFNDF